MSDPTQPDGLKPDLERNGRGDEHGGHPGEGASTQQQDRAAPAPEPAAAGSDGGPMKPQAYVDPSFAAEAQIAAAEAEAADWKDKYVRAHAEMDNLRKRTEREKADASKYAISKFAGDVLAVADNLQRALAAFAEAGSAPDSQTKTLIDGIGLTEAELQKALDRHGVRRIEALGRPFDPHLHQAVMEEENRDVAAGSVLRVFQDGYQIGDRVLRPTMVVVARGGFKPVKSGADAAAAGPAANDDNPQQSATPPQPPSSGDGQSG